MLKSVRRKISRKQKDDKAKAGENGKSWALLSPR